MCAEDYLTAREVEISVIYVMRCATIKKTWKIPVEKYYFY